MELELGLSLANCGIPHKIPSLKELDLISYVNCDAKQDYYDDNWSSLYCQSSSINDGNHDQEVWNYDNGLYKKKKGFNEVKSSETLPLLLWDKHPNEEEDEDDDKECKRPCNSTSFNIIKNESDEVVGWPPIKSYRKKQNNGLQQQNGRHRRNYPAVAGGSGCGGSRSMYVKVQMQGCIITRKIDLKLYQCYEALTSSLLNMFGKGEDRMNDYKLTYQDGDGDWLLAGDVPWRSFIQSVQRLKMVRRDD